VGLWSEFIDQTIESNVWTLLIKKLAFGFYKKKAITYTM